MPFPPSLAVAAMPGKPSISRMLDGMLHVYRGDHLLLALPLPWDEVADRRPAPLTSAQKRKTSVPRIYNLSGRPALAAVT